MNHSRPFIYITVYISVFESQHFAPVCFLLRRTMVFLLTRPSVFILEVSVVGYEAVWCEVFSDPMSAVI